MAHRPGTSAETARSGNAACAELDALEPDSASPRAASVHDDEERHGFAGAPAPKVRPAAPRSRAPRRPPPRRPPRPALVQLAVRPSARRNSRRPVARPCGPTDNRRPAGATKLQRRTRTRRASSLTTRLVDVHPHEQPLRRRTRTGHAVTSSVAPLDLAHRPGQPPQHRVARRATTRRRSSPRRPASAATSAVGGTISAVR